MKKLLIVTNLLLFLFLSSNFIFLPKADESIDLKNEFSLTKEDIRRIRFHIKSLKNKTHPFKINKSLYNDRIIKYFKIVNNQAHPKWIKAYLFLLKTTPSLQLEESDC